MIIAEDMIQPEGFNIAEKCYPGIWVYPLPGDEPVEDLINLSHPYLAEAVQANTHDISAIYTYVGGRKGAEQKILDFLESLKGKDI
ncbi:hypothetical protein AV654_19445 [Paenibacillus elgii]|uniref:Uncharacterized protein n=1 Tax=Paenibacillus elgii TaxID=189691 RepID=A0A165R2W6_9BACL|nr:hypothetical protein AV654_19445 [Paenibacillus elgii]